MDGHVLDRVPGFLSSQPSDGQGQTWTSTTCRDQDTFLQVGCNESKMVFNNNLRTRDPCVVFAICIIVMGSDCEDAVIIPSKTFKGVFHAP